MSRTQAEARAEAVRRIAHARATGAEVLDLGDLDLEELPRELRDLPALRVLALGNQRPVFKNGELTWKYERVRSPRLRDLSPLSALTRLTTLDVSECETVSDLSPLAALTQLTTLNVGWCKAVSDLSPLSALTQLTTLDVGGCKAVSDLSPLSALTQLTALTAYNTAVSDLSPLAALTQLSELNVKDCKGIRYFAPIIRLLPQLTKLKLFGCNFADLPAGVCGSGVFDNAIHDVRAYFADLEAGARDDAEVKLFILGNGGVGKTQLRRQLCGNAFDTSVLTTHGVELDRFEIEADGAGTGARVNLWDFGGQDIYHGSHALFLDGHAVFVLLWHPQFESGEFKDPQCGVRMRNRPLAYWLDYVRAQAGPDAVVLLVQARADSRADEHPLPPADLGDLRVRSLAVSSLTGRGLSKLRAELKEAVGDLLQARPAHKIGIGRAKVRDQLRAWIAEDQPRPTAERTHQTITTNEFAALCAQVGGVSSAEALLNFLHRSGVLFYRPGQFGERVVLDQQWALNAIYTVFNRASVLPAYRDHGRFTRADLAALAWNQYSVAEQELFLSMMRECDICFEIAEQRGEEAVYLAPELLPDDASAIRRVLHGRVPQVEPTATATATFAFLHDGVLRSVLAALGREFRDLATYWKWGCFLYDERADCKATLEAARGGPRDGPGGGTITVRAWGALPDAVLQGLMQVVNRAAGRQEPEWKSSRKREVERVEPDFVVADRGEGKPAFAPGVPPDHERVAAISYAHGSDADAKARNRGAFADGLEAALRGWGYHPLRDINELANCGLIRQFVHTLVQNRRGTPRRVVLILSEKYLRSVYCMTELFAVYQLALGDQVAFADRVAPCVLEPDLDIDGWRGRAKWTAYWKQEYDDMTAAAEHLSADDKQVWHQIGLWCKNVGDMLTCVSNMVTARGFDALTANGFAAVRAMLERADAR
jgi:internalin A